MRSIHTQCGHCLHVVTAIIACFVIAKARIIAASPPSVDPPPFWHFSVTFSDPHAGTSTQVRTANFSRGRLRA